MQTEAQARLYINKCLTDSGWRLVDVNDGKANVLVEYRTESPDRLKKGFADYILLDSDGFPLAVIEAKAPDKHPLVGKEQAREYAESQNIRYVYLSNGKVHFFWDLLSGSPKVIASFHSQKELNALSSIVRARRENEKITAPATAKAALCAETVIRDYLARSQMADYDTRAGWKREDERKDFIEKNKLCFLREYQIKAVQAVQQSIQGGKTRFLLEMATGTGKTKTCAAIIKLFLRTGAAKRVLFLVDRLELETQALKAFKETLSKDLVAVIYKENRSDWRKAEIVVSTVQSFQANDKYREIFSPADFGLVISDEAHRSISGDARRVFEYFLGYKLGLTATPRDLLRGIWGKTGKLPMECELEKRAFLDTYSIFGCESGAPTFRYGLLDGVKDGYLVNPLVVDCRTEKTTQLLSEEGLSFAYADDEGEETEEAFGKRDFEKRYFSEDTNRAFVRTFMDNALRDPVSGEIGKSLVFCVSQAHAAKIANLLNEEAEKLFPGRYRSDFAFQVTSQVRGAQEMTVKFSENNLGGKTSFLPDYDSSRVRVCVTVAMMTTGYDCEDILNVVLMRPVFSPSEFIQMKGRGTRKHAFAWKDPRTKVERRDNKSLFRFFDFFANYEFFEEEYDYGQILKLPVGSRGVSGGDEEKKKKGVVEDNSPDEMKSTAMIQIGLDGMKIDREFWRDFENDVKKDSDIQAAVKKDDWEGVLRYIKTRILRGKKDLAAEPPTTEQERSLESLRALIAGGDPGSLSDLFNRLFGRRIELPTREQLLDVEFERFRVRHEVGESNLEDIRFFFKAYVGEKRIREIIDSGRLPELYTTSLDIERLKRIATWKEIVRDIKREVDLERFEA